MMRRLAVPPAYLLPFISARRVRLYDWLVVGWVVCWFALAAWIGLRLWQFADVGDSVADTGRAVSDAGAVIGGFGGVPLIGQVPARVGGQLERSGRTIAAEGAAAADNARQTAILLGIVVAVAPTVPIAVGYALLRPRRLIS